MGIFQSTPPAWEATIQLFRYQPGLYISIHAPAWGATAEINNRPCAKVFQSTPPHGERHLCFLLPFWGIHNFNPRSPHGERPAHQSEDDDKPHISIHAPRMGSDTSLRPITCSASYFNPRSPHGERPGEEVRTDGGDHNFNPRSPHGERRGNHTRENIFLLISIHAPRMGSDFARTADCSHGVLEGDYCIDASPGRKRGAFLVCVEDEQGCAGAKLAQPYG